MPHVRERNEFSPDILSHVRESSGGSLHVLPSIREINAFSPHILSQEMESNTSIGIAFLESFEHL